MSFLPVKIKLPILSSLAGLELLRYNFKSGAASAPVSVETITKLFSVAVVVEVTSVFNVVHVPLTVKLPAIVISLGKPI